MAPVFQMLSAQPEAGQQCAVTTYIFSAYVGQKPTPLSHQLQKAATALKVLPVSPQMACQLADSLSHNRYLDFSGAGILLVSSIFLYKGLLTFLI